MASILLIDDDDTLRMVIAEVLRLSGHTVSEAVNGKSGLNLYLAHKHDLVITDIVMPDMDGLELIKALQHAAPRQRIIAISGNIELSEPLYLPLAQRMGVQRALAKPVKAEVLLQAVAEVLAEPAPPTVPRPGK